MCLLTPESYYTKKLLRQILQAQQLFNDIQFA